MTIWLCRLNKEAKNKLKNCLFTFQHFNSIHIIPSRSTRNLITDKNHVYITTPQRSTQFYINTRFYAAPVQVKTKAEEKDMSGPRLNEKITASLIRLVVPDGEHVVISRHEALDRARKLKLDLVEVQRHADPPVCKLMDYHKEMYVKKAKTKERAKSKAAAVTLKSDCKEVRFGMKIEPKDLQNKADNTLRLVDKGYRVKCMVTGTEGDDMGGVISRLSKLIEDVCIVESGPHLERKQAYIIVRHNKFGPPRKGSKPPKTDAKQSSASSTDDDKSKSGKVKPHGTSSEWSALERTDDFDDVFNLGDVEGESTKNPSPPSKPLVQIDNRHTRNEPTNGTQQPSPSKQGDNIQPKPQPRIQERPPRPSFNDAPRQTPVQTDSRFTINGQPRNRIQPSVPTEMNTRVPPQFRGQEMPPPQRNVNAAPKQEKPLPEPPKSPPPSYGIFSTQKNNVSPKQGATEANSSNIRGRVNPNLPASSSEEGGQKQQGGGFGIFSKR